MIRLLKSKVFWSLSFVIASASIVIAFMPTPIDMDLTKIGTGKKSVVFVYDPNLSVSNQQTIEINKARDFLGDKVVFLVVKTGSPKSKGFEVQYDTRSSDLLFFDGEGKLVERRFALLKAEALIEMLAN